MTPSAPESRSPANPPKPIETLTRSRVSPPHALVLFKRLKPSLPAKRNALLKTRKMISIRQLFLGDKRRKTNPRRSTLAPVALLALLMALGSLGSMDVVPNARAQSPMATPELTGVTSEVTSEVTSKVAQGPKATSIESNEGAPRAPLAPVPLAVMRERLQKAYPATHFGALHWSAIPGLYEVEMGKNLVYVETSGQYFLFGHLFDMREQKDLTAANLAHRNPPIKSMALPFNDALTEVRGNGQRLLIIFSDPDCPYCRQLERSLVQLNNVTIHTFLMPLKSLHPNARDKAIGVWCSNNKIQSWQAMMRADKTPRYQNCAHPIERNIELAEKLGIHATPTLINAKGETLAGAQTPARIESWLDQVPEKNIAGVKP